MKKIIVIIVFLVLSALLVFAGKPMDLTKATIVVDKSQPALVRKAAGMLADDIQRISGIRPAVATKPSKGCNIIVRVDGKALKGWERYSIKTEDNSISITGSDIRGTAFGVLHVSEKIGVSPWYWFADIPVQHRDSIPYCENFTSKEPTVKYRGIFINDEDWGLKTWAADNYEKELGDIGPKTYERVCELLLRLKANMLAPAMHSCTGAFYSHPESQKVAAEYGIMITTSHCEPLLFNNASTWEWNKERDGEWNYVTNGETIMRKLNERIRTTAAYDNIYTMGMRGLHDEAMKGSTDNSVRARTLEKVFEAQKGILARYGKEKLPQIFVPYKETLDIYDAGLRVPEDITIVWPDDNYGYMKRVSNPKEQQRKGGSGVYYHLSYLGTPHDNLWVSSTAPVLMYEELMKAYHSGADRYWLLNVGDIKPMEVEMQTFLDLAWNVDSFSIYNINNVQAQWLGNIFGKQFIPDFQKILDTHYRLSWQRKPEFMGYEIEWDSKENERLHDSDFSFRTGAAQRRLADYEHIASLCDNIEMSLPEAYRPAFFEMLGFGIKASSLMNRKFLMAQLNHETGSQEAARESRRAYDDINALMHRYNTLLDGKWNQMMSEVPPGFVAQYQKMPELSDTVTTAYALPADQHHVEYANRVDLRSLNTAGTSFRIIEGMGTDWVTLQLPDARDSITVTLCSPDTSDITSIAISVLPMWPKYEGYSNRFAVSIDGGAPIICENRFTEWSPEWKRQVLENRKDFLFTLNQPGGLRVSSSSSLSSNSSLPSLPCPSSLPSHTLTIYSIDPGQFIQSITFE